MYNVPEDADLAYDIEDDEEAYPWTWEDQDEDLYHPFDDEPFEDTEI
jgi:hypothetical protein